MFVVGVVAVAWSAASGPPSVDAAAAAVVIAAAAAAAVGSVVAAVEVTRVVVDVVVVVAADFHPLVATLCLGALDVIAVAPAALCSHLLIFTATGVVAAAVATSCWPVVAAVAC